MYCTKHQLTTALLAHGVSPRANLVQLHKQWPPRSDAPPTPFLVDAIQREDGSGCSFNVTGCVSKVTNDGLKCTVYVRTID